MDGSISLYKLIIAEKLKSASEKNVCLCLGTLCMSKGEIASKAF